LILFDFVYPGHPDYLPREVMERLFVEARRRWSDPPPAHAFRGTLIDHLSYHVDVNDWGYQDRRRLAPLVAMDGELL
jgi:hypothetical protein